jgi:hypothetical protein
MIKPSQRHQTSSKDDEWLRRALRLTGEQDIEWDGKHLQKRQNDGKHKRLQLGIKEKVFKAVEKSVADKKRLEKLLEKLNEMIIVNIQQQYIDSSFSNFIRLANHLINQFFKYYVRCPFRSIVSTDSVSLEMFLLIPLSLYRGRWPTASWVSIYTLPTCIR